MITIILVIVIIAVLPTFLLVSGCVGMLIFGKVLDAAECVAKFFKAV